MEAYNTGDADVYSRIDALNREERELRVRLSNIREERERLKRGCTDHALHARAEWLDKLPGEFWWPSYASAKVMSSLRPAQDSNMLPPDLSDWQKTGGIKEFIWNLVVTAGCAVLALQVLFFLF